MVKSYTKQKTQVKQNNYVASAHGAKVEALSTLTTSDANRHVPGSLPRMPMAWVAILKFRFSSYRGLPNVGSGKKGNILIELGAPLNNLSDDFAAMVHANYLLISTVQKCRLISTLG